MREKMRVGSDDRPKWWWRWWCKAKVVKIFIDTRKREILYHTEKTVHGNNKKNNNRKKVKRNHI